MGCRRHAFSACTPRTPHPSAQYARPTLATPRPKIADGCRRALFPRRFLHDDRTLPPVHRRSRQRIGFAHSDPYLSTATPIATANFDASPSDLRHLLEDVSVGLIVLGSAPALDFSSYKEQLILPESVQAISSNSISCCEWECNLTLEEVRYHCSTSDHWENVSTALNGSGTMLAKAARKDQPTKSHAAPATSRGRHCLAAFAGRGDRRLDEYFRMTVLYRVPYCSTVR